VFQGAYREVMEKLCQGIRGAPCLEAQKITHQRRFANYKAERFISLGLKGPLSSDFSHCCPCYQPAVLWSLLVIRYCLFSSNIPVLPHRSDKRLLASSQITSRSASLLSHCSLLLITEERNEMTSRRPWAWAMAACSLRMSALDSLRLQIFGSTRRFLRYSRRTGKAGFCQR